MSQLDAINARLEELSRQISRQLGIPAPQAPPDIGAGENFANAFVRSLIDEPRIAFNELTGDTEEARQVAERAEEVRPVRPGVSATIGGTLGSLVPAIPALVPGPQQPFAIGATAALFGARGFGQQLHEIHEFERQTGKDVGKVATALSATGSGIIEGLLARFALGRIANIPKESIRRIGEAAAQRQFLSQIGRSNEAKGLVARAFLREFPQVAARAAGIEAFEESAEQVAQNVLDRVTGISERGLLEGVGQAALAGAIGGSILGPLGLGFNIPRLSRPPDVTPVGRRLPEITPEGRRIEDLTPVVEGEFVDPLAPIEGPAGLIEGPAGLIEGPRALLPGPPPIRPAESFQDTVERARKIQHVLTQGTDPDTGRVLTLTPQNRADLQRGLEQLTANPRIEQALRPPVQQRRKQPRLTAEQKADIFARKVEQRAKQKQKPAPPDADVTQRGRKGKAAAKRGQARGRGRGKRVPAGRQEGRKVPGEKELLKISLGPRGRQRLHQIARDVGAEVELNDTAEVLVDKIVAKTKRVRQKGIVDVSAPAQAVQSALRSKSARRIVSAGAEFLRATGRTFRNVTEAGNRLVRQFGGQIRTFVTRIFREFQNIARAAKRPTGQRGFISLGPKPKVTKRQDELGGIASATSQESGTTPTFFTPRVRLEGGVRRIMSEGLKAPFELFARSTLNSKIRPYSAKIAERFDRVIDGQRKRIGNIDKITDKALRLAGKLPWTRFGRATTILAGDREIVDMGNFGYGKSWLKEALEGNPKTNPAYQELSDQGKQIIDNFHEHNRATGKLMEDEGAMQKAPDGKMRKFRVKDGHVFMRSPTHWYFDIVANGPASSLWEPLILSTIDVNKGKIDTSGIRKMFERIHGEGRVITEGGPKRVNVEFIRSLPDFPTSLYHGGRKYDLLHHDPPKYIYWSTRYFTARSSFIHEFKPNLEGDDPDQLVEARKEFAKVANPADFDLMAELVQDHPTDRPLAPPGSLAYDLGSAANHGMQVLKSVYLTMSWAPNMAESVFGITPQVFGWGRYKDSIKSFIRNPKVFLQHLEDMGDITRSIVNMSFLPHRKTESLVRMFRETTGRIFGHHWINELQEYLGAGTAAAFVKDIKAGLGKTSDAIPFLFVLEGVSAADAKKMANYTTLSDSEKARLDPLFEQFTRKGGTTFTGANRARGESSPFQQSRIWRRLFPFTTYGQTKINSFFNLVAAMRKAKGDPELQWATRRLVARTVFGTGAQGAAGIFVLALAYGGLSGFEIKKEEAKDEPLRFLLESYIYATVFGPFQATWQLLSRPEAPIQNQLVRAAFPGAMLMEAQNFFNGVGIYKDRSMPEKVEAFFSRRVPFGKSAAAASIMGALGMGSRDVNMEAAIRGYWRWRFREAPPAQKSTVGAQDKDYQEFRRLMRRATQAMQRGERPGPFLTEAIGKGKDRGSVKRSLLARRLLHRHTAEEMRALEKRIGQKAVQRLHQHDRIMTMWANAYQF